MSEHADLELELPGEVEQRLAVASVEAVDQPQVVVAVVRRDGLAVGQQRLDPAGRDHLADQPAGACVVQPRAARARWLRRR